MDNGYSTFYRALLYRPLCETECFADGFLCASEKQLPRCICFDDTPSYTCSYKYPAPQIRP